MKKILLILVFFPLINLAQERRELRKRSPNRILFQIGAGVFSNYTYDWNDNTSSWDNPRFHMGNVTYSGSLGYRSGFNSNNYKFSSTGRDMNRGNVFAFFYQGGTIDAEGLSGLNQEEIRIFVENLTDPVRFTELQVGVIWREFLKISGGKGSVRPIEDIEDLKIENVDYTLFTTGVSLRFGRLCPTLNWTLMSADSFETTISRFDIQISMNIYFWKKILDKDKHLISD